ncbi:MAG: MATE family efflux transporter, partial [bacterium]|nr:MATE family efflux transporter [bacterium]
TMVVVMLVFHEPLLGLFLGKNAPVIAEAWHMQLRVSWSFLAFGCTMILFGVMRANGVVVKPLLILMFTLFVVRIGFYYLLYPRIGADALWFSFPAGSFVSLLLGALVYLQGGWRKAKLMVPVHEEECREAVQAEGEPVGRIAPAV